MMQTISAQKPGSRPAWQQELLLLRTGSLRLDVSMAEYCTIRSGGPAAALLTAAGRDDLARVLAWLEGHGVKWRIIGRGSNILVSDQGFDGVMIVLGNEFCAIKAENQLTAVQGKALVRVGAGCSAARLVGWAVRHGLAGVEFLTGIPGSIGGAARMNAGAWGGEMAELVREITVMDRHGNVHALSGEELEFSYRRMRTRDPDLDGAVIIEALLELVPGRQQEIIARCRELAGKRRERQPGGASAGSFFRNPPGDSAGRLIDAAGLKGLRRGDAMVSTRHANFIVNTGRASAQDILGLMREVQEKVFAHSGVRLEPEVHLV